MKTYSTCPNCQIDLKPNMFTFINLLKPLQTEIINLFLQLNSEAYCVKCGLSKLEKAIKLYLEERKNIESILKDLIFNIPVISVQSPNWDYSIIDMVSAQSVTGTGVMTELASTFTDLFGKQSKNFSSIIRTGENICFAQLRKKALDLGGTAVIATDIDYSEVGGAKGMLMVCMAGTAIKIKNIEVLGEERSKSILDLIKVNDRLNHLHMFDNILNI